MLIRIIRVLDSLVTASSTHHPSHPPSSFLFTLTVHHTTRLRRKHWSERCPANHVASLSLPRPSAAYYKPPAVNSRETPPAPSNSHLQHLSSSSYDSTNLRTSFLSASNKKRETKLERGEGPRREESKGEEMYKKKITHEGSGKHEGGSGCRREKKNKHGAGRHGSVLSPPSTSLDCPSKASLTSFARVTGVVRVERERRGVQKKRKTGVFFCGRWRRRRWGGEDARHVVQISQKANGQTLERDPDGNVVRNIA